MTEYHCDFCCSTGILLASLVKDEVGNNKSVQVLLCNHFDELTQSNMDTLEATGLPVEIIKERPPNFIKYGDTSHNEEMENGSVRDEFEDQTDR